MTYECLNSPDPIMSCFMISYFHQFTKEFSAASLDEVYLDLTSLVHSRIQPPVQCPLHSSFCNIVSHPSHPNTCVLDVETQQNSQNLSGNLKSDIKTRSEIDFRESSQNCEDEHKDAEGVKQDVRNELDKTETVTQIRYCNLYFIIILQF